MQPMTVAAVTTRRQLMLAACLSRRVRSAGIHVGCCALCMTAVQNVAGRCCGAHFRAVNVVEVRAGATGAAHWVAGLGDDIND
jgi:hypothetical protein